MKELYVVFDSYQPSSAGTNHLLAYVKGFAEVGVKVTLFFLCPSLNKDKLVEKTENINDVYLWDRFSFLKNRFVIALLSSLRLLLRYKKDIPVYISGTAMLLPLLSSRKGIKIYHERTENPEFSGRIHSRFGDFLFNRYVKSLRKIDGLFVITPSLRDFYIKEYNLNPEKVHVVNMVVDFERFTNIEETKTNESIAYCGTISQRKDGILYLLRAFFEVVKKYPTYQLKIAGKFENKEIEKEVKETIRSLEIKNVVFVGAIPASEMPVFLASSSILALARPKQKERAFGFATKIGEYLMTTRPVVMTNIGDSPYYLKDKDSVIFAEPNDSNDFAQKLLWAIEHQEEAKAIGVKGREVALNCFNYKKESHKVIKVIFGIE